MKPVNLAPAAAKVAKTPGAGPSSETTMAIGIIGGGLVVIGIALFFAFGRISSMNEQATTLDADANKAKTEMGNVQAQINAAGQRKGYSGAGEAASQAVLVALNKRQPITAIAREVRALRPKGHLFYDSIAIGGTNASAGGVTPATGAPAGSIPIKVTGIADSIETVMALRARLNASRMFDDAAIQGELENVETNKGIWRKFTMTAVVTDPTTATPSGAQPVSNNSQISSDASSIALEPSPGYEDALKKKAAADKKKKEEAEKKKQAEAEAAKPSSFESMSGSMKGASS